MSLHGIKVRKQKKQWLTIFGGSKITADGDCNHEIKRCLLLGRKAMTNLGSILKSRDITLPTKVHIVKAMVFPVVTYGCESSVQSFSHVRLFVTPWIPACQASLSITNSRSLLKLMPIESVMPCSHLILLSSPSPPAPNPSQHQDLFQWVNSSREAAKVLEFQLQHQSFQWTPRTDLL